MDGDHRIYELICDFIIQIVQDVVTLYCSQQTITQKQVQAVYENLSQLTGFKIDRFEQAGINDSNIELFEKDIINFLLKQYDLFRNQANKEVIQQAEKWLMLETIDQAWKQHMLNLDHLKEGIGLRGWGQKTPLIEYKREAFDMFKDMMQQIHWDVVRHIFHLNVERFDERALEAKRERELEELNLVSGESESDENKQVQRDGDKVGRNDPCPCGSEKKYKKCHG